MRFAAMKLRKANLLVLASQEWIKPREEEVNAATAERVDEQAESLGLFYNQQVEQHHQRVRGVDNYVVQINHINFSLVQHSPVD